MHIRTTIIEHANDSFTLAHDHNNNTNIKLYIIFHLTIPVGNVLDCGRQCHVEML